MADQLCFSFDGGEPRAGLGRGNLARAPASGARPLRCRRQDCPSGIWYASHFPAGRFSKGICFSLRKTSGWSGSAQTIYAFALARSTFLRQKLNRASGWIDRVGRAGGIRTRGLLNPIQALYQAEPRPVLEWKRIQRNCQKGNRNFLEEAALLYLGHRR